LAWLSWSVDRLIGLFRSNGAVEERDPVEMASQASPVHHHESMHPVPPRVGDPIGFAHRGARSARAENTIEAFALALELGATGLESDAWITADGQVVLDHEGVTGPRWRRRPISAQTRSRLPAHIPALADLYAHCSQPFELSLDVKDPAALPSILAAADAAASTSRLWLCHEDWRWLAGWRATAGLARLVQSTRLARITEGVEARATALRDAGLDALNLHRRDWTAEHVAAVHAAGIRAFGWDAQSPSEMVGLLRVGVDGIYSDHVELLMAAIADESGRGGCYGSG
jgi:glycerophosphoryl diester phosphodiesterase